MFQINENVWHLGTNITDTARPSTRTCGSWSQLSVTICNQTVMMSCDVMCHDDMGCQAVSGNYQFWSNLFVNIWTWGHRGADPGPGRESKYNKLPSQYPNPHIHTSQYNYSGGWSCTCTSKGELYIWGGLNYCHECVNNVNECVILWYYAWICFVVTLFQI